MKGIETHRLGSTRSRSIAAKLHVKPLALLVSLLATGQALAVQTGTVAGGTATITTSGTTTTIKQTSDRAIVNWNNFDIAQGEQVTIQQPTANAAILNRVVGATTATQIQGALDANGRVFVINPNGIVVGQGGTINANGVVLSTLDLSDLDQEANTFMTSGTFGFGSSTDTSGVIQNNGKITSPAGAILLGYQVVNGATGQITADQGDVSLLATNYAEITLSADSPIMVGGQNDGPANSLVANDGDISTGGSVLMQASAANAIVRHTGTIEATGLANLADAGTVNLIVTDSNNSENGLADLSGTISAEQIQVSSNGDLKLGDLTLDAPSATLSGTGQANITGKVVSTSGLSISAQTSITQDAGASLGFADTSELSASQVTLNGEVDAGSWYDVYAQNQSMRFAAGLYQPGQGFGGANALPAAPRGGVVTSGTGAITQNGNATFVTQTSDKLIIDWLDFNIAANESITFMQPNANAVVLNMVDNLLSGATTINGGLNANGRVLVLNPNGIAIGKNGTINVNSVALVGGTLLDDTFFTDSTPPSSTLKFLLANNVQNEGTINTLTGATLLGNQVLNLAGSRITSGNGNIALAAGASIELNQNDDGSMKSVDFDPTTSFPMTVLVANDGRITAGNGFVQLEADGTQLNSGESVRNNGQIEATGQIEAITDASATSAGLGAGDILISGHNSLATPVTVNIGGPLTGQNVTIHSDGDLNISGNPALLTKTVDAANLTLSSGGTMNLAGNINATSDVSIQSDGDLNIAAFSSGNTVDATNVTLSSGGTMNLAGGVNGTSKVLITGQQGVEQTADGRLSGDIWSIASPNSVILDGTIDASQGYNVSEGSLNVAFAAGLYQPGQGYGGAHALPGQPLDGTVTSGTATILLDGKTTNVTQTSDKLIIDWQNFNIAADETFNFLQPNANAAVLNKVNSGNTSTINGALNANGRVFILNPAGIVIGSTGTINTNSLTLAAGALLSDSDFLTGQTWGVFALGGLGQYGLVKNSGTIHTTGSLAMIGNQVMNMTSGIIFAGTGNLAMVAGGLVQVSQNADGSMSQVDALTASDNALVANDGRITADNGYAKLDAYTSTAGQGQVARNTGQIDALNRTSTISAPGALAAGNILVSGRSVDGASGTVNIRGALIGQNVTVHSDGELAFNGGTLSLRERSTDTNFNAITLEGNRITIGSVGTKIVGNAVLQGVGDKAVFDQQGAFTVTSGTQSMLDIETLDE
jgi:filamentous hemagglutinin family protein